MEEKLSTKYAKIFLVVALYWAVSISMVFMNKSLLGGAVMTESDTPIFITFFQCFTTVICCIIASELTKLFPRFLGVPDIAFHMETAKKILPLSIVFVAMVSFNNLCLKYVGVAFYYVGRSLSTVFNVLLTYFMLGQKTSKQALGCCVTIMIGYWLGVDQEASGDSFSLQGVFFGVTAALCVALYSIYTKKVLPVVDGSIWLLSYYNNVIACGLFMPLLFIFGEVPKVMILIVNGDPSFWLLLILSGIFGFAIGYVTSLQIKVTSPLTHMISGTAKACAQTVIATWWYVEQKASLWWFSNWVVLGGSLGYSYVKAMEMKQTQQLPVTIKPEIEQPLIKDGSREAAA